MGLTDFFKRVRRVYQARSTSQEEVDLLRHFDPFFLQVGNHVELTYELYEVVGRTEYHHGEVMLTLNRADVFKTLLVWRPQQELYPLYELLDARLKASNQITDTLILDGVEYFLETQHHSTITRTDGLTRFGLGNGNVWTYKSDDNLLLRLECFDNELAIFQGSWLPKSELKVLDVKGEF